MNYFATMSGILKFKPQALQSFSLKKKQIVCILNIAMLGILYGGSAAFFSQYLFIEKGVDQTAVNNLKIIVAGIPVAFLMHAAAALFMWVFLKAIGGKALFLSAYFDMGAASVSLWPLAPVAAALQSGIKSPALDFLGIGLSVYGFCVIISVLRKTFELSKTKMVVASSITTIYVGCFMYLWL